MTFTFTYTKEPTTTATHLNLKALKQPLLVAHITLDLDPHHFNPVTNSLVSKWSNLGDLIRTEKACTSSFTTRLHPSDLEVIQALMEADKQVKARAQLPPPPHA